MTFLASVTVVAGQPNQKEHGASLRIGRGTAIVAVRRNPRAEPDVGRGAAAGAEAMHPRPRLAGFSPFVAITASDRKRDAMDNSPYEHTLHDSFVGNPLVGSPAEDYVVGFLDSGSDADLAAGSFALHLGIDGSRLTGNKVPIGGVGGQINADITQPIGVFAAGLGAIDEAGLLDVNALVGHSNVAAVVAPQLDCGNGEILTALVGTPFLAFRTSVIRVDTPRSVTVGGLTFSGPDVTIQSVFEPIPPIAHSIPMEIGGLSALVTTANFFIDLQNFDLSTPATPTLLSLLPSSFPSGGLFFAEMLLREGEPGFNNPLARARVMVDTGAQASVLSEATAANLNLPFEPDFAVDICGVAGLIPDVPGYYVDYVRLNARGGAMEFSRAPFIVVDLPSPEGGALDGILGMNFFWNRNVVFDPFLQASSFISVSDPIPIPFGDSDVDFDVDLVDAGTMVDCLSGPVRGVVEPQCHHLDADGDDTVDLRDYQRFAGCYNAGDPADPTCGE